MKVTLMMTIDRNELAYTLKFKDIPPEGISLKLTASDQERSELETIIGVQKIDALNADVSITPIKLVPGEYHFKANLKARVTQPCVVTLEPMTQDISEHLEIIFTPEEEKVTEPLQEGTVDPSTPFFELIEDEKLDLGEILEQYLAVSINMYPRRPDAPHELSGEGWTFTTEESMGRKAFANLDEIITSSKTKPK